MNQIHEKDWAEDDWGWHTGMRSNQYEDEPSADHQPHDGGDRNAKANNNFSPA